MLKVRQSRDRLIFNMGIPIPGRYNETGSRTISIENDGDNPDGFKCTIIREDSATNMLT